MNQQQQNHRHRTDSSLSRWRGGGLNAFYRYKIFALNSVVVKTKKLLSSRGGFLTNAMYHLRVAIKSYRAA